MRLALSPLASIASVLALTVPLACSDGAGGATSTSAGGGGQGGAGGASTTSSASTSTSTSPSTGTSATTSTGSTDTVTTSTTTSPSTSSTSTTSTHSTSTSTTSTHSTSTSTTSTHSTSTSTTSTHSTSTSTTSPSTSTTSTSTTSSTLSVVTSTAACTPGAACYTGPLSTLGVGACVAGTCDAAGACAGEVLPRHEVCGAVGDLDCDGQPAPACVPLTGHPRLWITPSDVIRLRTWATPSNPMYQQVIAPLLAQAEDLYSSQGKVDVNGSPIISLFPPNLGGAPNPLWPDDGGTGYVYPYTESLAQFFAFVSLLQDDFILADDYAQKARKLLMYVLNKADACTSTSQPFCGALFPYFNRANYVGEAFGLTVDWIYPYLTAQDKTVIRRVFLKWANQMTTGGYMPDLTQVVPAVDLTKKSNPQLLTNQYSNNHLQARFAANNYFSGTVRNLTLMTLAVDGADDPPVDPSKPASKLGNTLGSYLSYVFNVAMYQQHAIYQDPETVIQDYALSPILSTVDRPGLASGGLSVEGMLYGHSLGYVLQGLLGLHTAGYDDEAARGPQARFFASPYWDKAREAFLASLLPTTTPTPPGWPMGTVTQMTSFGDLLTYSITWYDHGPLLASLALRDGMLASPAARRDDLWALVNTLEGGQSYLATNLAGTFRTSGATTPILAFLALDPAESWSSYADPRPTMPLTFVQEPIARIQARTAWGPNATWFTHVCGWKSLNHQVSDCGQVELHRNGEWLTSERHNYDNSVYSGGQLVTLPYGYSPDYHNALGLQNDLSHVDLATLDDLEKVTAQRGGQWINGLAAGDPATRVSAGDALPYAYAQDDMTNLYNRVLNKSSTSTTSRATAIQHASRGALWIKPDHVVLYDRATSGPQEPGAADLTLWKRFHLMLITSASTVPTITPNAAGYLTQAVTPKGQSFFVQTVLPNGIAPALLGNEVFHPSTNLDPTTAPGARAFRLRVEDPGSGSHDTRFLHVLQGADAGAPQSAVARLQSAGSTFEGVTIALAGRAVVALFPRVLGQLPSSVSYAAPAGANEDYLLDLLPDTTYHVTVSAGGQVTVATTPSAGSAPHVTDAAGVLRFTF